MKNATFGVSHSTVAVEHWQNASYYYIRAEELAKDPSNPFVRAASIELHELTTHPDSHYLQAINNYRANRENGESYDTPKWQFPTDGEFSLENPNNSDSKIVYREGPGDKKWMALKDKYYKSRMGRRKATPCSFFAKGNCKHASNCDFLHNNSASEKKHLAPSTTSPEANLLDVPNEYICPITCDIMEHPVIASDGFTYEKSAIKTWMNTSRHPKSPKTGLTLANKSVIPNQNLRILIQDWKESHDADALAAALAPLAF